MISSCTVPIIRAPVSASLRGSRPGAFLVMSAAVPWTGVLYMLLLSILTSNRFYLDSQLMGSGFDSHLI
jgi:hypothetical protein